MFLYFVTTPEGMKRYQRSNVYFDASVRAAHELGMTTTPTKMTRRVEGRWVTEEIPAAEQHPWPITDPRPEDFVKYGVTEDQYRATVEKNVPGVLVERAKNGMSSPDRLIELFPQYAEVIREAANGNT